MTPKFKVGDRIRNRNTKNPSATVYVITAVGNTMYLVEDSHKKEYSIDMKTADNAYDLSPTEVTITKEKLMEIWDKHLVGYTLSCQAKDSSVFSGLCKELGL